MTYCGELCNTIQPFDEGLIDRSTASSNPISKECLNDLSNLSVLIRCNGIIKSVKLKELKNPSRK